MVGLESTENYLDSKIIGIMTVNYCFYFVTLQHR